jgi:hypothetical protein
MSKTLKAWMEHPEQNFGPIPEPTQEGSEDSEDSKEEPDGAG